MVESSFLGIDPQIIALSILALVVVALTTERVTAGVVGLGAIVLLVLTGLSDPETAFATLGSPIAMLIASAFVFGTAFFKVGLADDIGRAIRRIADRHGNGSEAFVITIVMVVMVLMSTVLPNTGVAAALLPILLVVSKKTGISSARVLMPAAFASSLGGMITLIGSPNNLIGRAALETEGGRTLGFLSFAPVGLPIAILSIIYLATIGSKLLPATAPPAPGQTRIERSLKATDPDTDLNIVAQRGYRPWHRTLTIAMFGTFILGITFAPLTGIPDYIVGMIAAGVLMISGVLGEVEAFRAIDWSSLFFIVGIVALAQAITDTGANDTMAQLLVGLLGGDPNVYVLIAALFTFTAVLTQFMSNTATAGVFAPVAVSIGLSMGGDPTALVLAVVYAASCAFATPIGTPANMMMAGPGFIRFFDWFKVGWPLFLIAGACCVILLPIFYPVL